MVAPPCAVDVLVRLATLAAAVAAKSNHAYTILASSAGLTGIVFSKYCTVCVHRPMQCVCCSKGTAMKVCMHFKAFAGINSVARSDFRQ